MTNFSTIKVGNAYVVRADGQGILKVASRRMAAQLISEAEVLLNAEAADCSQQAPVEPSIDGEASEDS